MAASPRAWACWFKPLISALGRKRQGGVSQDLISSFTLVQTILVQSQKQRPVRWNRESRDIPIHLKASKFCKAFKHWRKRWTQWQEMELIVLRITWVSPAHPHSVLLLQFCEEWLGDSTTLEAVFSSTTIFITLFYQACWMGCHFSSAVFFISFFNVVMLACRVLHR